MIDPLRRERVYVFIYKAGRHEMSRYRLIDFSGHGLDEEEGHVDGGQVCTKTIVN